MKNRERAFALMSVTLSTLLSQMARAQDNLLSRGDENRSQFAGSTMKRVQSYGQPVSPDKSALPGDVDPAGAQAALEGAPRSKGNRAVPSGPQNGSDRLPAANSGGGKVDIAPELAQMQPRAFKNIPVQTVYLNGVNVVGLRNQTMKGVNIRFDENGNVFIDAPQYEVQYDTSYHPLLPDELPGFEKQQAPLPSGALGGENAIAPASGGGAPAGSRSTSRK